MPSNRALLLSNDERDGLRAAWAALGSLLTAWDGMGEAARKRLASGAGFGDAMAVLRSIEPGLGGAVDAEVARLGGRHGGLAPAALIDGAALIASGMRPGPSFSSTRRRARDRSMRCGWRGPGTSPARC